MPCINQINEIHDVAYQRLAQDHLSKGEAQLGTDLPVAVSIEENGFKFMEKFKIGAKDNSDRSRWVYYLISASLSCGELTANEIPAAH